ncbi:MAG: hypothetical protein NT007_01085 [Candidatus Kapabacteria bacterium]|nr:hypothetical protein [Candidatus Kapabacteria bacterium]
MGQVKNFELNVNNPITVVQSIMNMLNSGWTIDNQSQTNHNAAGDGCTGEKCFYFKKDFSGRIFSLALCCDSNKITSRAIQDITVINGITNNQWNEHDHDLVVMDFATTFFPYPNMSWFITPF